MFGQTPKEPNAPEVKELQEVMFSIKQNIENDEDNTEIEIRTLEPEIVTVVGKITGILSPYFIVLVGLSLYDRNAFIGIILILTGVGSILGVSATRIGVFMENVKKFFGLG